MRIITQDIFHWCPYRSQQRALATCYLVVDDPDDPYCYDCDMVPVLQVKYGLRTFTRRLAQLGYPETLWVYVPIAKTRFDIRQRWMVLNTLTGERRTFEEHIGRRFRKVGPSEHQPLARAASRARNADR